MKKLQDMSIAELRKLNTQVIDMIKAKKVFEATITKAALFVGQKVGIDHKMYRGVEAKITKINKVKVHVSFEDKLRGGLIVPMDMLITK
jgi:hypothetical protein